MESSLVTAFECSPVAQFAIGLDHRIIFWNKACEALTGYPASEMVGTNRQWKPFYPAPRPVMADLLVAGDFGRLLELYIGQNARRSPIVPNAWEAIDYFENLGGRSRIIQFLASPIFDAQGRMAGVVETLLDLTDRGEEAVRLAQSGERREVKGACVGGGDAHRRFGSLIGKSRAMQEVYELIIKAAGRAINTVITGESGTGKELVARAIHDLSDRCDREFVAVNCGAIPETLMESEFFGYRKGAFTGAVTDKSGYLDRADGGTLFLDEVGELSTTMQVKLLRALEGNGYMPVGGSRMRFANFRVIAATNRKMFELLQAGLMREDFYFRINILPIHLPPLRDRLEDVELLVRHYFERQAGPGRRPPRVTRRLLQTLERHNWPGNIRELQNVLERYLTMGRLDFAEPGGVPALGAGGFSGLRQALDDCEKKTILQALQANRWHRARSAAALGIGRKTLLRKMIKYGLTST